MTWVDECPSLADAALLPKKTVERWLAVAGYLEQSAVNEGIPLRIVTAVAYTESRFNPKAQSKAGARGIMQLMPATGNAMADELDVDFDPFDPENSIALGVHYLKRLRSYYLKRDKAGWDWPIAAYFAGPGNVNKHGPSQYSNYVNFVRKAEAAWEATRDRCEDDIGGGTAPAWPSSSSSKKKKKNGKKKKKKKSKAPKRNGKKPKKGNGLFWVLVLGGGGWVISRSMK